jgi:hypothetical protein
MQFARLREAGGEERYPADLLLDAIGDDARRHRPRHGADHVVDLVGDVEEALVVGHAQLSDAGDLVGVDLHRVHLPLEGAHAAQPKVAQGPLIADHGYRPGVEDPLQPPYDVTQAGTPPIQRP